MFMEESGMYTDVIILHEKVKSLDLVVIRFLIHVV